MRVIWSCLICLIFAVAANASPLATKYLPPLANVGTTEQHNSYSAPISALKFGTAPNVANTISTLGPFSSFKTNSNSFSSPNTDRTSNFGHGSSYAASSNVLKSNSAPFSALKLSTASKNRDKINILGPNSSLYTNSAQFSSLQLDRKPIVDNDSSYAASSNVFKSNSASFSTQKFGTAPNVADDIDSSATFSTFNINLSPSYLSKPNATPINEPNSSHAASTNVVKNNSARFSNLKFSSAPNIVDNINSPLTSSPLNSNAAPSSPAKSETPIYEIDGSFAASRKELKNNSARRKVTTQPAVDSVARTNSLLKSNSATVPKQLQANSHSSSSKNAAKSIRYTEIVNPVAQTTYSATSITSPKLKNVQLPPVQNSAASFSHTSYSAPVGSLKLDKPSTKAHPFSNSAPLSVSKINSPQSIKTIQHLAGSSAYIKDFSATLPTEQQSYSATAVNLPQHSSESANLHTSFHHSPAYRTIPEPTNPKTTAFVHTATAPIKSHAEKASTEHFEQAYFAPSAAAITTNHIYSDLETEPGITRFKCAVEGTRYAENGGYLYR